MCISVLCVRQVKEMVFNLDLNWQSVSASRTVLGRLFQSLGAK